MEIKAIRIDELPPELGPPGERLIVLLANGRYETMLVEQPISMEVLTKRLIDLVTRLEFASKTL